MKNKYGETFAAPSFGTFYAASKGDTEAMESIKKHYSGYIKQLSTRFVYGADGKVHSDVDEELRGRLETKLIMRVLTLDFDAEDGKYGKSQAMKCWL